jgi:hypothetical protein
VWRPSYYLHFDFALLNVSMYVSHIIDSSFLAKIFHHDLRREGALVMVGSQGSYDTVSSKRVVSKMGQSIKSLLN